MPARTAQIHAWPSSRLDISGRGFEDRGRSDGPRAWPKWAAAISVRRVAAEQIRPAAAAPHWGRQEAPTWALQEDHLMQTFIVEAANRPGELARVADTIARRGINVEAFCLGYGTKGAAAFLASDDEGVGSSRDSVGVT